MAFDYLNLDGLTYFERKLKSKVASSSDIDEIFGKKTVQILPFATATDAQITAMLEAVRNGDIDIEDLGWKVGDEHTVHISAMEATGVSESHVEQDATFVILHGKDMFDLVDGGKNLFVIGMEMYLMNGNQPETGYINPTNTNVGGWNESARYPWCDNVFKPALPTEVQKWFKEFYYKASAGKSSAKMTTSQGYFTLPAEVEVTGTTEAVYSSEGSQFDYFISIDNRRRDNNAWWLRSPSYGLSDTFRAHDRISSGDSQISNYMASNASQVGFSPFGCV